MEGNEKSYNSETESETMRMVFRVNVDKSGLLKDLEEIKEMANELERKAMRLQARLTMEEPAKDDSSAGSK